MTSAPRNLPAIALASLIYFALGGVWFSILKNAWLAGLGLTMESQAKAGASVAIGFGVAIVTTILIAFVLDWVIRTTGPQTVIRGIGMAILIWCGFILTTFAAEYAFEYRSLQTLAIVAGYPLTGMVLMGAILGGWKKKASA